MTAEAGFGEAGSAEAGGVTGSSSTILPRGTVRAGTGYHPYSPTDPRTDAELVVALNQMFQAALDHPTWSSWRDNALKCFQYREGEQWSKQELAELKARGQPDTRNNQIHVTIERMVGQFVAQRTRLGFRGRTLQDQRLAETYSDLLLFIKQQTGQEFEERDAALDGFTSGFGCVYLGITFNDLIQPTIDIRHKDCFTIFPDPYSRRYNWNEDAGYICEASWTDLDDLIALYPDKRKDLVRLGDPGYAGGQLARVDQYKNDTYVKGEGGTRQVRPVHVWYKRKERLSGFLLPDGTVVREEDLRKKDRTLLAKDRMPRIDKVVSNMLVGTYVGDVLLERKASPYDHKLFPYVPYYVHRRKSGEPYSQIFIALSMQDAINKRESKGIHQMSTNQIITEANNIENKAQVAAELARPDGIVEVRSVNPDKFILRNNIEMAAAQLEMHREAKADFRKITGINPDALGEKSEVRSGVGIARKQAMTDLITVPVYDNFRRTRAMEATLIFGLIRQFWTEEQVFAITDDLGRTREIKLDAGALEGLKQRIFDVVVEDLPDTTTIQQEQFDTLAQTLPQILPFGPIWTKLLLQMSQIRDKDAIIKQVEEQSQPPPPEPKISLSLKWEELPPEEKMAWAVKFGFPELAQAIQANPTPPASQAGAEADIEREQAKTAAVKEKAAVDIQKSQMDLAMAREKHQLDVQKAQLSIDTEQAKSQIPPRPRAPAAGPTKPKKGR